MNPHKPKIVAGRVKKSPSTVAILNTSGKTFYNGGITIDSKANAENIREISRKLGYNILQDATFVYVPASYGESKNFSQNSSLNNLVLYSEDFTNAVWTKSFTTISSNTTANPIDGKITASRLIEGSGNNNFRLYESIISTTPTNTFSIYIKKYTGIVNEKQYGYVRLASYSIGVQDSSFTTVVDLQNGIITDTKLYTGVGLPIGNISYSLVDAITYWRISITTTNPATTLTPLYCECGLSNSATPIYVGNLPIYTGNTLSYITVWGAQFQTGTTATTYQRTTDGIIDLNFTRAISARVLNKQGIIEDSCYNLFTWSQDFENAAWVKEHTTITPNVVVAPNGTLTADKMIISDNTSNSWNRIYNQLNYPTVPGSFYTASFYVKKGELDYLMVRDSQSSGPSIGFTVNLNNAQITQGYYDGNVASALPTTYSATIDSNGWVYVKYTYAPSTNATTFWRYLSNSVNTTTVVNMSGASTYLWGQQLEIGSTARPYLRTTTRLNVPKLDYGRTFSKPSLLIEPQRTNLLLQSTFNGSWSSDPPATTIIPNYTISPDATLNAAKLTESQFSSPQDFYQPVSASANQPYTFSVYAKAAERNYLRMTLATTSVGSGVDCYFDLTNGVITNGPIAVSTVNNVSAFIYNAGNGWYRCSVTVSFIGATTMYAGIWTRQIPNGNSYLGTLGYGFYIWGAQVEAGLTATSYIPTVGAQVTRNGETSYVDLFNNNMLNKNNFTLYWEGYLYEGHSTGYPLALSDVSNPSTIGNQIGWFNTLIPFYSISGTSTFSPTGNVNNSFNRFAIQYSAGTANFYLNGMNVFSNKTVPIFDYRYLVIGSAAGLNNSTYSTDKIILWNRTLSNNECFNITNNNINISFDIDASAFISAGSITNATHQLAINQLVIDLKSNNLWTNMIAIYPFVGGNPFSHKFNLKDPRDLDAAFRIVFSGTITHSSTGAKPDGTTGYADTLVVPSTVLNLNNLHFSYYSRENIKNDAFIGLGASSTSSLNGIQIYLRGITYNEQFHGVIGQSAGNTTLDNIIGNNTDSRGLFAVSRIGTSSSIYKNGISLSSKTSTIVGTFNTGSILLMARRWPSVASAFDTREIAFTSIGSGLTDTDIFNLYNIVQQYQTTLGRQV